ncbi:UNVERIFIED_CONTAM: hypothetical protein NCL1_49520 [Trichonephila clavipes]
MAHLPAGLANCFEENSKNKMTLIVIDRIMLFTEEKLLFISTFADLQIIVSSVWISPQPFSLVSAKINHLSGCPTDFVFKISQFLDLLNPSSVAAVATFSLVRRKS